MQPDHLPCLFFSCRDDGTITEVNETLCKKLGYSKESLLELKADQIFTLPTRIFHQTHLFPLLKMQGFAEEIFITLKSKNQEQIPVIINAERKVIDDIPLQIYIGIIVHNRRKFEDDLIAAKKNAEAALNDNSALRLAKQELYNNLQLLDHQLQLVKNQNAELKQFNRVVTHNLVEPLRKLLLFTDMLLQQNDYNDQRQILQKISRSSQQMSSIVFSLQEYVLLAEDGIDRTDVDLNNVYEEAKMQLENEFEPVTLKIEAETLPVISGDHYQLRTLFYQILSNAVKYRKPGDEVYIKISADILKLNKFRMLKGRYKYVDFVRIQITDTGIGFNPQYKEQIFELFKRLHPGKGAGTGLSLCRKIAENHQGSIDIESKENEETTVTIHLPLDHIDITYEE